MSEEVTESSEPKLVEASVWRLSADGLILNSVVERHVDWLVKAEPSAIFFYADLGDTETETLNGETMNKVWSALSEAGLSESQIIEATNHMQNAGILFRERIV